MRVCKTCLFELVLLLDLPQSRAEGENPLCQNNHPVVTARSLLRGGSTNEMCRLSTDLLSSTCFRPTACLADAAMGPSTPPVRAWHARDRMRRKPKQRVAPTMSGRLATSDLLGIAFQIGDGPIPAVMISTNAWRGVALLLSAAFISAQTDSGKPLLLDACMLHVTQNHAARITRCAQVSVDRDARLTERASSAHLPGSLQPSTCGIENGRKLVSCWGRGKRTAAPDLPLTVPAHTLAVSATVRPRRERRISTALADEMKPIELT